jgi:hypothetical protein
LQVFDVPYVQQVEAPMAQGDPFALPLQAPDFLGHFIKPENLHVAVLRRLVRVRFGQVAEIADRAGEAGNMLSLSACNVPAHVCALQEYRPSAFNIPHIMTCRNGIQNGGQKW